MDADDPYDVLGVDRDATDDQIRAAFRGAIRRAHPDRIGTEANHRSITALVDAWRLLRDPAMRAGFDEGHARGVHGTLPSDRPPGSQLVEMRASVLIRRLFLVATIATVAAIGALFLIAMTQSG